MTTSPLSHKEQRKLRQRTKTSSIIGQISERLSITSNIEKDTMNVTVNTDIENDTMKVDEEEPILKSNPKRFVLFPIRYHEVLLFFIKLHSLFCLNTIKHA